MEKERTSVIIVGAGPAGLVLGLSLAKHRVKSVILERDTLVTQDPRGVYLAGDAVRILWELGLGPQMKSIGYELPLIYFHAGSFTETPFHSLDLRSDSLQQTVPSGILHVQPLLEKALRDQVNESEYCELRLGCTVKQIQKETSESITVAYETSSKVTKQISGSWLVGADGKKGVVRKEFLEPTAGIRQVETDYQYEGTWVASNLEIHIPTPETHPDFPLWASGMTPQDVYELFWPTGWHFCCPPCKPTASGRFGPAELRLWRHEFRQDDWNDSMDAEALLWEHILPMLTRSQNLKGHSLPGGPIIYPQDCIKVLRCRPFTFQHRVVNRWFDGRCVLIGDAAHVFPPFGGQGIASGIRDAHQLSWRLAIFASETKSDDVLHNSILNSWAAERNKSIKAAAALTKMNGTLCNESRPYVMYFLRFMIWITSKLASPETTKDPQAVEEARGFQGVPGGFFLSEHNGGGKFPQLYVDASNKNLLSDGFFLSLNSPLRLLILSSKSELDIAQFEAARKALTDSGVSSTVLSSSSIVQLAKVPCRRDDGNKNADDTMKTATPTPKEQIDQTRIKDGYDDTAFQSRLGDDTEFAILRPDFYIFATAKSSGELDTCLAKLRAMLELRDTKILDDSKPLFGTKL